MGFRSLISLFLVALPIGATLAILLSWDHARVAAGQTPLFVDNSAQTETYCQKSYGISPGSVGQRYTLNPNQWGWNPSMPGHLCLKVTSFGNETYSTPASAPPWSVTWKYDQKVDSNLPVHAFPNIAMDATDVFPARLDSIAKVNIDTKWTYGVGHKPAHILNAAALTDAGLNANVAIDMFLDSDSSKAQQTVGSKYEVMVWLGQFGPATQPIGFSNPIATTRIVDGVTFSLYHGSNVQQQTVLTWLAAGYADDFTGDISILLQDLEQYGGPKPTDYLGYMGLGSETYYTTKVVTFNVPKLAMKIQTR